MSGPRVEVIVEWPCSPECCCGGHGTMPKLVTGILHGDAAAAMLWANREMARQGTTLAEMRSARDFDATGEVKDG